MKHIGWVVVVCVMFLGCGPMTGPAYREVTFTYPGASAEELDECASMIVGAAADLEVVRTVAETDRLQVYIRSPLSTEVIAERLSEIAALPADMSLKRVQNLSDGLPPLPAITDEPHLVVTVGEPARDLGITSDEIAVLLKDIDLTKDGADAIAEKMITTHGGQVVPLRHVAKFTLENKPSHVVREYDAGAGQGGEASDE